MFNGNSPVWKMLKFVDSVNVVGGQVGGRRREKGKFFQVKALLLAEIK